MLILLFLKDNLPMHYSSCIHFIWNLLSQPNNNHNPNNKTTITVVGLIQSNRWEPASPPIQKNSKLYDRAEKEQNLENKNYWSI